MHGESVCYGRLCNVVFILMATSCHIVLSLYSIRACSVCGNVVTVVSVGSAIRALDIVLQGGYRNKTSQKNVRIRSTMHLDSIGIRQRLYMDVQVSLVFGHILL